MRILTLLITACAFALAGCNTVEGVGKDIKKAGEKLEGAASKKDDKSKADAKGDSGSRSGKDY